MQLDLFGGVQRGNVRLDELFAAYLECRRNKRRTTNALAFEVDFEQKLIELWKDVNDGTYMPGRSIAFIVTEPVQREVFAADFRDRIIHHLIIGKLNHLFEASFIQDSYSCRDGKGTQYGIGRVAGFIRECSRNYTKDCYILKMDIQSFFMSIDKGLLYKYLREFILARYHEPDQLLILELVEKVVFNDPEQNCHIKGRRSDWDGLPPSKIYLQHFSKGVKFIGAVVKPGREYIGNRTKGNLYAKIHYYNKEAEKNPRKAKKLLPDLLASVNSYLGFMIHYKTYKIRRRLLEKELSPLWRRFVTFDESMRKLTLKEKYKPAVAKRNKIRNRRRRLDKAAAMLAAAA